MSSKSMSGKTVFITGGTSGIGRATAIAFANEGANVVITGRRQNEGDETIKAVQAAGAEGLFIPGTVTDEQQMKSAVAQTVARFGGLHFAFNNAGIEGDIGKLTTEQTAENYHRVMDANVLGVWLSMKYEIPAILASGGGSIVNNSSIAGLIGFGAMGLYTASKHAVAGLTKSAALEFSAQGVRVNAVAPAVIETEMADRFIAKFGGDDFRKQLVAQHPIGRVGRAEEVAQTVVFLASDKSSFISGQIIAVDGAYTAQ